MSESTTRALQAFAGKEKAQNENTEAGIVNRNILRVNIPWPAATTGMKKTR
jgi:hypothetical protein